MESGAASFGKIGDMSVFGGLQTGVCVWAECVGVWQVNLGGGDLVLNHCSSGGYHGEHNSFSIYVTTPNTVPNTYNNTFGKTTLFGSSEYNRKPYFPLRYMKLEDSFIIFIELNNGD